MASNVLTLAARGNVSYSVSLTTAATLLSPLAVPAALWLILGSQHPLDPVAEGVKLVSLVVGPVVVGHLLCRWFGRMELAMRTIAPVAANLAILTVIAVVVGINRERLGHITPFVLAALLTMNLLGYAAGYGGGRLLKLPEEMRRAMTLEVGMQNAGLGTVMALEMFPDLHDTFWKAAKLCSKNKQEVNMEAAQELLRAVEGVAAMFHKAEESKK